MKTFQRIVLPVIVCSLLCLLGCTPPNFTEPKHTVPIEKASSATTAYKEISSRADNIEARSKSVFFTSEVFTKDDVLAVLNEDSCTGIRIYHGLDSSGKAVIYIVGTNGKKDLLPSKKSMRRQKTDSMEAHHFYILESDNRCPDICPGEGEGL